MNRMVTIVSENMANIIAQQQVEIARLVVEVESAHQLLISKDERIQELEGDEGNGNEETAHQEY